VSFWEYVDHEHPHFLVYAERGTLRETLNLGPGCDGARQIGQTEFRCTFASQVYRVYELSYR